MDSESEKLYRSVQEYYGKVLSKTSDLKTEACICVAKPCFEILETLKLVPDEIISKFYGCGNPIPLGIDGLSILDLGCGSGRDCYVACKLVGEKGHVTGIDMTKDQLAIANKYVVDYTMKTLGYPKSNLSFVNGHIEFLERSGIKSSSLDLVISNCVVNLSPNKLAVLQSVWNVLKFGGEFHFSDVYCDRRLPESVRNNEILWGECIAGALYIEDFIRLCHQVGFIDPRVLSKTEFKVTDKKLSDLLGPAKFYSITYRLFKLADLETLCEDYGQIAYYKGTIEKSGFALDDHHYFEPHKPYLVCGNTASMLGETWLKSHFKIVGDRSNHFGLFPCGPSVTSQGSSGDSGKCC
jgi:arsenite methyltransferase